MTAQRSSFFLAERGTEPYRQPTPLGVLRFLQDPSEKALFISEATAIYSEKTGKTYALCAELERIWEALDFEEMTDDISNQEDFLKPLKMLMSKYSKGSEAELSPLWSDFEENKAEILESEFFLKVLSFKAE